MVCQPCPERNLAPTSTAPASATDVRMDGKKQGRERKSKGEGSMREGEHARTSTARGVRGRECNRSDRGTPTPCHPFLSRFVGGGVCGATDWFLCSAAHEGCYCGYNPSQLWSGTYIMTRARSRDGCRHGLSRPLVSGVVRPLVANVGTQLGEICWQVAICRRRGTPKTWPACFLSGTRDEGCRS